MKRTKQVWTMKMWAVASALCCLMLFATVAYATERVVVVPYVNTNNWTSVKGVPWGKPSTPIYKQILPDGSASTEDSPIWGLSNVFYYIDPGDWGHSCYETGYGTLAWILNVHNPNSSSCLLEISLRTSDGAPVTDLTKWLIGENNSNQQLVNTVATAPQGANYLLYWDTYNQNKFYLWLGAGVTASLPAWGTPNALLSVPQGGDYRQSLTIVITSQAGSDFNVSMRTQGFKKFRMVAGNGESYFYPNAYEYIAGVQQGRCLDDYQAGYSQKLLLPWFRERRNPSGSQADWSTPFHVLNAGPAGNITIRIKDNNGYELGYCTKYFNAWEKRMFAPNQFIDVNDLNALGGFLEGQVEVEAPEDSEALPVCTAFVMRFSKTQYSPILYPYASPQHYVNPTIPVITLEDFQLLEYEIQN